MIAARFALLLPLAIAAIAHQAAEEEPFAGIPNVEMSYYDVSGKNAAAIRKDMNTKRPADPAGYRYDGVAKWSYRWRTKGNGRGGCDLNSVEIEFRATVTVPRFVGEESASKSLRERWQRYHRALMEHEAGHIRYAWDQREAIATAIKGATCATANQAGEAVLDRIHAHDRDYDAKTRHGATQGAVFP